MRKYLALMNAGKANSWHRFLLARFNADYIMKFPTAREIKQAFRDLSIPETTDTAIDASNPERENERRMNEVYSRILGEIRKQHRNIQNYVFRALSWIGYATRTLTKQELLAAISVEANQYQLDDSDVIAFEDLLDYCNGLVIADGKDVRLVHFSVRNYLDRYQVIPENAEETYRAIACSTYLSFDRLKGYHCDLSEDDNDIERNLPFLDYAANNLTFHLSKVEPRHFPETTSAVMELLAHEGHRCAYCKANNGIGVPLDMPRFNLACAIGYDDAVRTLLEEGNVDVNAKGSTSGLTPLSWAVLMGYEVVIKRLLGEDKVDRSCDGSMPLSLAIGRGETGIVRLLLEKNVEVNFTYDKVSQSGYSRPQCYPFVGANLRKLEPCISVQT